MAYKFNPFTGNLDEVGTGGAGSTPGGTDGAVQYNDGGVLKGNSDFTVDPDWNDAATVFTGLKLNVTDTASAAGSNLLDLQVNGTSRARFTSDGLLRFTPAGNYDHLITFGSGYLRNDGTCAASGFTIESGSGLQIIQSGVRLNSTASLGWSFGNPISTALDTFLYRDAAGILAQRNGTNAQTYRLYNTYTDASNYQRTSITDDSTGLVIDQQYAGTGAVRTNLLDLKDNGTSKALVDKDGVIASTQIGGNGGALVVGGTSITACRSYFGQYGTRLYSNLQFAWGSAGNANLNNLDTGLKRDSAGVVAVTDGSTGTGYLKQTPVAVSALPAAATVGAGTRGFVSDSTVAASGNFGATVTGGGSNNVPVFSDGTNWLIG